MAVFVSRAALVS